MKNKLGKVLRVMLLTLTIALMYSMNVSAASGQASIGSKNYATVQKALTAVQNGQTIKLNKDVTLKDTLLFKKNVTYTFDMNKHKITSKIIDEDKCDLEIKAGKVTFTNGTLNASVFTRKGAALTVNGGNYKQILNWGKTVINKGSIVNSKYSAICNYSGTLLVKKATVKANYNCVYAYAGTVTIKGGDFRSCSDATSYPVIYSENATVNLKGGRYVHLYWKTEAGIVYNKNGKVTISGGDYGGTCASIQNYGTMTIKGGTFLSENSPILHCGAKSTTTVTGGELTSGSTICGIEIDKGRKKFSMTGGTLKTYTVMALVICHGDKKNVTLDKKKANLIGERWEDISVQ